MRNTPFNEIKVYGTNPFKPLYPENDFRKHKVGDKFEDGSFIEEDGTINEALVAKKAVKRVYDRTQFVKLYLMGIEAVEKMSNPGIKFFICIIKAVMATYAGDYVVLPINPTLFKCGYGPGSRKIYYSTIKELLDLDVLKKKDSHTRDHYWVNANMFFNGDRIKLFNDFDEYFKQKYGE